MNIQLSTLLSVAFLTFATFSHALDLTDSDYGLDGDYEVDSKVLSNPIEPTEKVFVYYPKGAGPSPTLFYLHGFGGGGFIGLGPSDGAYDDVLKHFASRGYTVVFPTMKVDYKLAALQGYVPLTYKIWWAGIKEAEEKHGDKMDTDKIGVIGHSLGGGAVPWIARKTNSKGWGSDGLFMVQQAPWYSWLMSNWRLENLPDHHKYLGIALDEDTINSHRMTIDINEHLATRSSEREYLLYKDCDDPNHNMPIAGGSDDDDEFLWRHLDALADYTFEDSLEGRYVALGIDETGNRDRSAQEKLEGNDCRAKGMDDPYKTEGKQSGEFFYVFNWNRATVLPSLPIFGLNPRWYPWEIKYSDWIPDPVEIVEEIIEDVVDIIDSIPILVCAKWEKPIFFLPPVCTKWEWQ